MSVRGRSPWSVASWTLALLLVGALLGGGPAALGQSPAAFTWVRTIVPVGMNANGGVFDTAFDSAGNPVAAGRVGTNPGGAPQSIFTVAKYDRQGNQAWLRQINGNNASARVVAVDGEDAVIAGGFAGQPVLIKWNKGGGLEWSVPPPFFPSAIAVDSNGDIFLGGGLPNNDWAVAKFRKANGSVAWMRQGNGGVQGTNGILGLAVDRFNHVAAAGYGQTGGGPFGFLVMRLNGATGAPFWSKYDGGDNDFDQASSVAVNNDGDVIAGGYFTVNGQRFFTVAQYNAATGAREWINQTVGGATPNGWASAVGVQSTGNAVGFGYIKPPPDSLEIEAAAGFNGSTGARLWQSLAPGETGDQPFAFANAGVVAHDDKLISGGGSGNRQPFTEDFTVWQRTAAGSLSNTRTLPSNGQGEVLTLATDATGNIAAGGYIVDPDAGDVQFTLAYIETAPPTAVDLRFGQQPTNTFEVVVISPPVTVRIVDAAGATVTTATNAVTLAFDANPGGATLGGTKTVAAVNGIATFNNLTVSKPGNGYSLKATAAGLAGKSATSRAFNVAANTARQLSIAAPPFATVGEAFDIVVTALNASGAKATNYRGTVTLTSSKGATITPTPYTFTAADAGEHRFKVTLTALGAQTLTATDATLPMPSAMVTIEGRERSSVIVTTHLDVVSGVDGVTSLREAILTANGKAGKDTITFKIPGAGLHTLRPTSPLPTITDSANIDGYSQPGASPNTKGIADGIDAALMIELSGQDLPAGADGIVLAASGCVVKGLVINRFISAPASRNGAAIRVNPPGSATITGCFLGTNATGAAALPNNSGIWFVASTNNVIGGESAAARNLISGNGSYGILSEGAATGNHQIRGNYIGVDATGTKALGNFLGIAELTAGTEIGGTSPNARNVIAGSKNAGVLLDTSATGCKVQGNYLGTNAAGTAALPNQYGVFTTAANSQIGGGAAGAGNLISGNENGVYLQGAQNSVQGNIVGLDVAGELPLPSKLGIVVVGSNNTVGGTGGAANVVSASTSSNILVQGSGAVIQGNRIGTNRTGTKGLSFTSIGLFLQGNSAQVGGQKAAGNLISGNSYGVLANGNGNTISGNRIGTDASGKLPVPNVTGVALFGSDNTVGGVAASSANILAHQIGFAIGVGGTAARNALLGNSIYDNGFGIDLNQDAVSPNDATDADNGANHTQNTPVLSDVAVKNGKLKLSGSLRSRSGFSYRLEFFSSPKVTVQGQGQAKTLLGSQIVKIGGAKNSVKFTFSIAAPANAASLFYTATASLMEGAAFETSELCQPLRGSFTGVKINFQPPFSTLPEGYIFDSGERFGQHFGYRYGWNDDATADTRDRDSAASPDQRYDTLIHMQKGKKVDWEIELPNGKYTVHLVAGDPDFFDSVYSIDIEDKKFLRGIPLAAPRWFEETGTVTVKDGRLTINNGKGAVNNKLCFIEITPL